MTYPELRLESTEPTFDDPEALRNHQKRRLALAYRVFGAFRWGTQGDGHITVADPEAHDHLWLLRYGVPFSQATIADLALINPAGEVVEAQHPQAEINPAAYFIHWPLHHHRRDVVAAAHTHTAYGTPFSAEVRPIEPITQESCAFINDQAIFDDEEVDIRSIDGGHRIAAALDDNNTIILRNHGILTVGDNIDAAVGLFIMAERAAEAEMKAREAKPISTDAALTTRGHDSRRTGWIVFNYALRTLVPDPTVVD